MPGDQGRTFISYAREDSEFGLRLAKDLRAAGLDLWLDQLDIHPGERWDQSVEKALRSSASLLVVLSPTAVGSNNVMDEIAFALEEDKRVIPVLHRACEIPFRLRRVQRIDFTAEYQGGLRLLLRSLGVEERPTGPERQRQESAEASPTPPSALPRTPLEPLLPTLGTSAAAAATPVAGAATAPAAARAETAEAEAQRKAEKAEGQRATAEEQRLAQLEREKEHRKAQAKAKRKAKEEDRRRAKAAEARKAKEEAKRRTEGERQRQAKAELFCSQCGADITGLSFCSKCGAAAAGAQPAAQPLPQGEAASSDKRMGALAYVTVIPAIIFLIVNPYKNNPFIRFPSFQSIFFCVAAIALMVLGAILRMVGLSIGMLLGLVVDMGFFVLWIVLLIKAFQGQQFKLPVIGDLAQKQV